MGINYKLAKEADKIAKEMSKKNGIPEELNLSAAYDQIMKESKMKSKPKLTKSAITTTLAKNIITHLKNSYNTHVADNDGFGETFEKWFYSYGAGHISSTLSCGLANTLLTSSAKSTPELPSFKNVENSLRKKCDPTNWPGSHLVTAKNTYNIIKKLSI